jgi:hypothetical protein
VFCPDQERCRTCRQPEGTVITCVSSGSSDQQAAHDECMSNVLVFVVSFQSKEISTYRPMSTIQIIEVNTFSAEVSLYVSFIQNIQMLLLRKVLFQLQQCQTTVGVQIPVIDKFILYVLCLFYHSWKSIICH